MRTWRTDFSWPVHNHKEHAKIHSGFELMYNSSHLGSTILSSLKSLLNTFWTARPVYVVGHSMGGALAQLCALDTRSSKVAKDIHVYTFGAPRIGNYVFADLFADSIVYHWRFTHNRDIVPSVPPEVRPPF